MSLMFHIRNREEIEQAMRLLKFMSLTGKAPEVDEIQKLLELKDALTEEVKQLEAKKMSLSAIPQPSLQPTTQ